MSVPTSGCIKGRLIEPYLEEDGPTRGCDDIFLPSEQEDDGYEDKDSGGYQEGLPITIVSRQKRSGDSSASAQVDCSIEP